MTTKTKKIYPKIRAYEHIVSYNTDKKGILKKNIDITKTLKNKKLKIKGMINGKHIRITKKIRFPPNLISPNKGLITSRKNSFVPKSILKPSPTH